MSSSPVVAEESDWDAAIPADASREIATPTPNPVAAVKRKPGRPKGMVGRMLYTLEPSTSPFHRHTLGSLAGLVK